MRDLLTKNLGLKFLSLLFAISLWLFVNLKATAEKTVPIPVRWENVPSFLEITNAVSDSVRVQCSGPRRILSHLDGTRSAVMLDLSDAKVGLSTYQITKKMIGLPPGIRATVLPPDTVQFKLELIVTKTVPVRPRVVGDPPEGYVLGELQTEPRNVEIVGAQSEVQAIFQLETEPVDLGDKRKNFETTRRIDLNRQHVWVTPGMETVLVRGTMEERAIRKRVTDVPVEVSPGDLHVTVEPKSVIIVLDGMAGNVSSVRQEDLRAVVEFPDKEGNEFVLPVQIRPDFDGVLTRSIPAKVVVRSPGAVDSN